MESLLRELVSNVLSRLPAKDLMRCKCVCKSWYDLIIDPQFISNYYVFYNSLEVQREEHLLLIRKLYYRKDEISIVSWNPKEPKGLVSSQFLNPHPHQSESWGSFSGPCNGIYFLEGSPSMIMNPSLGQFIALPEPHFTEPPNETYCCENFPRFGFDPKTNDYKVVMITDLWVDSGVRGNLTVQLYSLNSNSWRNLGADTIPFPFALCDSSRCSTYVNNCCHWLGYVYKSQDESVDEYVVLSFDMVYELFRKIKMPQITHSSGECSINLTSFSESATIVIVASPIILGTNICSYFDVWMMKDYWDDGSWVKQYSVGHLSVIYKQLVGFYRRNLFLCQDANNELVLYDPQGGERTRNLQFTLKFELRAARYMESLVSLKRGN